MVLKYLKTSILHLNQKSFGKVILIRCSESTYDSSIPVKPVLQFIIQV